MNPNLYNVTTPDGACFNVMLTAEQAALLVTSEPGTVIREL